jgi:molybdopterin-guanine dinucleotide biosynthesis protein MobB
MKIFGIAGFKNTGKTTLMVELIGEMRRRGLRVATVKHAHHDFDIDHPGKDSYQHRHAGAAEVIVASAKRWAHISELDGRQEPPLDDLLSRLSETDIVLIEGYKHGSHPKLELRRDGVENPELAAEDPAIKAIVADYPLEAAALPVLARENVAGIADFILQTA